MKIFKENIENVERALNSDFDAYIELSPVLADAIDDSRKVSEQTEEIIEPEKLKNKKPFLGAEKQPIPEKVEEFENVKLDESLFEDVKTIKDLSADDKNSNTVYTERFDENLSEDKYFDFKSDIFNAISDVCFKYRNDDVTKSDVEKAIEWFLIKFFDDEWEEFEDEEEVYSEYDESLEEASNLKDYSNKETKQEKEQDNDLWSQVYKELCPARSSEAMDTKVKMKNKKYYKDENVSVDTDGNIVVYAENESGLELAKKVAEYYDLETKFTQSPDAFSMKYPKKQVSLTLIIPE